MVWYDVWVMIGWSILGIIVLGCVILAYLMYADALARQKRNIAAPMPGARKTGRVFDGSNNENEVLSRKERRSKKVSQGKINMESSDRSTLWNGDDDFDITNGKD